MTRVKSQSAVLKGWKEIAQFLGQPSSTIQRWAKEGMPVERKGRTVQALADELNLWLERETHEPVQIVTDTSDLSAELRRGLSYVRHRRKPGKKA
jgi:hypothetical protein